MFLFSFPRRSTPAAVRRRRQRQGGTRCRRLAREHVTTLTESSRTSSELTAQRATGCLEVTASVLIKAQPPDYLHWVNHWLSWVPAAVDLKGPLAKCRRSQSKPLDAKTIETFLKSSVSSVSLPLHETE